MDAITARLIKHRSEVRKNLDCVKRNGQAYTAQADTYLLAKGLIERDGTRFKLTPDGETFLSH